MQCDGDAEALAQLMDNADQQEQQHTHGTADVETAAPATPTRADATAAAPAASLDSPQLEMAMLDELLGSPGPAARAHHDDEPASSPPSRRCSALHAAGRPASPMTDAADSAVAAIPAAAASADSPSALQRLVVVTPLPPDRSGSNASCSSQGALAARADADEATGIGDDDTHMAAAAESSGVEATAAMHEKKVREPLEPMGRVQIPTPLPPDALLRSNSPAVELPAAAAAASRSPPLAAAAAAAAVAPPPLVDIEEDPFFSAPSPIPPGFQLGFSTGGGKKLTVSAAALRAAEAKMKRAAAEAAETKVSEDETRSAHVPAARASAAKRSSTSFDDDEDSWGAAPSSAAASVAVGSSIPPAHFELGFSTGGGKKLAISDAALRAAEAKMRRAAEEADQAFAAADSEGPHSSAAAAAAAAIPPDFQLGFSTGQGKKVDISAVALKRAQEKIKEAEAEADAARTDEQAMSDVPKPFSAKAFVAPAPFKRPAAALLSAAPLLITPRRAHHVLPSLPLPDQRSECSDDPTPPSSAASAAAAAPIITADALLMDDSSNSSDKPTIAFAPDRLREAREFMEKHESDAFSEMTATDSAVAASSLPPPPRAPTAAFVPAVKSKEDLAMELMEEFEAANGEGKTTEPSELAAAASNAAATSASSLLSPPSGAVSASASKRRKSNFSSSLPMPVDDDGADDIINDSPPRHTEKQPAATAHTAPAAVVPLVQTPIAAARPPITPQSMPPPAGPPASRKRRAAAFVSPRVATKPVLALTSTLQQQPNLLSINRAATTQQHQPGNGYAAAAGFKQTVQGAMQQLMPQFPVLPGLSALPLPAVVPPGEKVSLRTFSARCDAKLVTLAAQPEADLMWPAQTSIPAESITSVNAGSVLFVPPPQIDPNGFPVPQPFAPSLGWLDVRAQLLAQGCPAALCSIAWVRIQYRWIVWKLASYDRRFGAALQGGPACTFQRVVAQCLQRYDREQNQIKQPALRRILEGDEAAGKYLVLVVAQLILPAKPTTGPGSAAATAVSAVADDSIPARPAGCDVELSDGWYSIWAKLDPQLHYQMTHGKIKLGHKLRIWGAALEGPQPTTPLENSSTFLKLHINGVRRARFDAKLGVQRRCAFLVSMASLRPDGGPAPAMRVVVSRQYPVVYMHPPTPDEMPAVRASAAAAAAAAPASSQSAAAPDAAAAPKVRKLHCNQRAHDTRMAAHVKLCDKRMENLRRAFEDRRAKDNQQVTTIEEQQAEDEEWQQERAELEAEMQDVCKQVIPYLKLHLCEVTTRRSPDGKLLTDAPLCWSGQCCLFTVWRPGDEHLELLVPGKEMIIYGFTVHARYRGPRGGGLSSVATVKNPADTPPHPRCTHASSQNLQLSTTRQTNIVPRALAKLQGAIAAPPHTAVVPLRTEFLRSPLWMRPGDLWSLPRQGEFDLVCVVLWCGDDVDAEAQAQQRVGVRSWSKRRRLLCAGLSGDMLLVELAENKETLFFGAAPATPMLMQMENLQYQRFEKKLNLHTASATALSVFKPRGAVQIASVDKIVAAASCASHALFAHPSLSAFQSWVCSPTSALVWRTMLDLAKRMIDGRWCGDQTSSFNKEEFGALLSCPVNGQLLPLTTAAGTMGSVSLSLTPLLSPPMVEPAPDIAPPAPVSAASADAMVDEKDGAEKSVEDASAVAAAPVAKRKSASLLVPGSYKPPPSAGSSAAAIVPSIDDPILADDCLKADPSASSSSVCYHPSHTLGHLLDASHWSMQLCLDDGTGGCWPLQLNSRAFRRVMEFATQSTDATAAADPPPLRDSLLHLLRTGAVPILSLDPVSGTEEVLMIALAQSRRRAWEHMLGLFHLANDEPHQSQQLADLIMLLLSHSSALPLVEYAEGLSGYLSSVSPIWSTALQTSPLPRSPAVGVLTPSPTPAHSNGGAASLLSPSLLLETRLVFSPSHADEMRVRIEPAAAAAPSAAVQPMDTEDAQTEEKQPYADPAASPAPLAADSPNAAPSTQAPLDSVHLSATQLSHLQLMLAHVHAAADLTPASDGTTASVSAPPLFFFTPAEWRCLCELLCSALSGPTLRFQLAECERHVTPPLHGSLTHRVTSAPFRSVFIPQPDNISSATNKHEHDGHAAPASAPVASDTIASAMQLQ